MVKQSMETISVLAAGIRNRSLAVPLPTAAATSKFLDLASSDTELTIEITCTQAGGLMSAQYSGMIKRAQHAFSAHNGLFGALLARTGYVDIKEGCDMAIRRVLSPNLVLEMVALRPTTSMTLSIIFASPGTPSRYVSSHMPVLGLSRTE